MTWNARKDMKTILFSLEPRDAEIYSGEKKLDFKARKDGKMEIRDLLPGTYSLIFKKQGYLQTERKDVEVQENKVTELGSVALIKLPTGAIALEVKPENPGITVYVNNEPKKVEKIR